MDCHVSTKAVASESAIGDLKLIEDRFSLLTVEKHIIGDAVGVMVESKENDSNENKDEKCKEEFITTEDANGMTKSQYSSGDHILPEPQASGCSRENDASLAQISVQRRFGKSRSTQTILSNWNQFDVSAADPNAEWGSLLKACDMDMRMIPPSPSSTESTEDESYGQEEDTKRTEEHKVVAENSQSKSGLTEEENAAYEAGANFPGKDGEGAVAPVITVPYSAADNEITGVTDSSVSDNSEGSSSEFEELDTSAEASYPKGTEFSSEDIDPTTKSEPSTTQLDEYNRSYGGKDEDDLDVDELADPELREWLRRKLLTNVDRGRDSESEYDDDDDDEPEELELAERTDVFVTEDKGIQINEDDFDDGHGKQTRFAQLSNWLTAKAVPTLGMISQVSRLIQTDCSHLQDLLGDSACRLRAGLDQLEDPSECEQDLDSGAVCEEETVPCHSPVTTAEEEGEDDSDASSVDGISDFDLDQTQSTEMPEHLEKLLNSLHRIPPVKSEDGKQNMWMVPSQDDNGNCMNVILDDGEVYDIYIFRPRCPTSTVSTQTAEAEFAIEKIPETIVENLHTEIIVK